jgi:DNA gyrase/topoisomerase IV subunit A
MMRLSLRIVILCLIVSIGAGIGIGQAIAARQIGVLDSQVAQREEQLYTLNSEIKRLTAEIVSLAPVIAEKQASYNLLRTSFAKLSQEYQVLRRNHEALKEANNGVTVEELIRLREQVSFLETHIGLLDVQVAELTAQLTPYPHRAVVGRDIWGRPGFKSTAWAGRDIELIRRIEEIGRTFHRTHIFIEGEMDCNDMAVSLWNMLLTAGIKSVIVVGNLDMVGETLAESNHAWLYVFNARGEVIYLEPTTGEVFFGRFADGSTNLRAIPYREGFIYVRPSDLRKDLKGLW